MILGAITLWGIITWVITTAAISYGISYLGGLLFGQDLKQAKQPRDSRDRMWNPRSTQSEGLPWVRAYGENMSRGNIVAKWTDVNSSDRETLYLVIEHGEGPTKGNVAGGVYLNDQPAANFEDIVIDERTGTLNQTCPSDFSKTKLEYGVNVELKKDEIYTWTTPNDFFDDIEFTIAFPNGLVKYHKDGGSTSDHIDLRIRISEHAKESWTVLFDSSISKKRRTPYFIKCVVSNMGFSCVRGKQYDLEFWRKTKVNAKRHVNNSYLRSIREVVDVGFTRPGKALTFVKAIATEKLSGDLDVKVIREDRLVNVYDGVSWNIEYSRNRAWIVFDILTRPVISGDGQTGTPYEIESYDGINPSYMDVEFFYNWADFCSYQVLDGYGGTEDRLPCDIKIDYQTDVWTIARDIAEVGRAHLYWQGNLLTGWIDKAVSGPTDLVTMDNIIAGSWQNQWVDTTELAGGIEISFEDKMQGYERVCVPFSNSSAGNYKRIISIEGVGIRTYGLAIRIANHALERNRLIRNINRFQQYKDAFRHKLGDVIRLQNSVTDWGKNYRVVSKIDSSTAQLDRTVQASPGDALHLRVYDAAQGDISIDSYVIDSVNGANVKVQGTWDVDPQKGYLVAIGSTVLRRITRIESLPGNYNDVTVETYDPDLFDADSIDPDAPNKNFIWTQPRGNIVRPVNRDEVADIIDSMMPLELDTETPWLSNIEWTADGGNVYWDSYAGTAEDQELLFRYRGVTYEITPGYTSDEFIYWDPNYTTIFKTTDLASVALASGNWLVCVNRNNTAYPCVPITLLHGAIIQAGTITAEYGQIANAAILTANIADAAVETAKIKDLAVTSAKIGALAVNDAKIANLAVKTAKIDNLSVTTGKIADGAAHVEGYSSSTSTYSIPTSWTSVVNVTVTSVGNLISVVATCTLIHNGAALNTVFWRLRQGSSTIIDEGDMFSTNIDEYTLGIRLTGITVPGSGSITFYLDLKSSASGGVWQAKARKIYAIEHLGK